MSYINHNIMAANAANALNANYGRLAVSTQRLSSGLRVNSAADDAAGLAIRELMRADVAALHQGVRNANDAISMIQVADGALAIIDEKLIRMKELAEQAATGTYDSTQRLMIDSEFQAMGSEINRIANATDFNGIKLLDGKFAPVDSTTSATRVVIGKDGQAYELTATQSWNGMNGAYVKSPASAILDACGDPADIGEGEYTLHFENFKFPKVAGKDQYLHMTYEGRWYTGATAAFLYEPDTGWSVTPYLQGDLPNYTVTGDAGGAVFKFDGYGTYTIKVYDADFAPTELDDRTFFGGGLVSIAGMLVNVPDMANVDTLSCGPRKISNTETDIEVTFLKKGEDAPWDPVGTFAVRCVTPSGACADLRDITLTLSVKKAEMPQAPADESLSDEVIIHFGPGNDAAEDKYAIKKGNVTLAGLGLKDVSVQTQEAGQQALTAIDEAIAKKDQVRAYYGAMQNRLENTVANLTIQAENLQASESRISDADIAAEMTQFVRNQVLTQTATAMLGQANSYPRLLMSLLTG